MAVLCTGAAELPPGVVEFLTSLASACNAQRGVKRQQPHTRLDAQSTAALGKEERGNAIGFFELPAPTCGPREASNRLKV